MMHGTMNVKKKALLLSEVLQASPARPSDNISIKIKRVRSIGRMILTEKKETCPNATFYTTDLTMSYPGSKLSLRTKRQAMKTELHLNHSNSGEK